MKFAYSTRIFRLRPLSEAIEAISEAGFCAAELLADRPHAFPEDLKGAEITALNECLQRRKLKITNLNSCVSSVLGDSYHPSWIEEDWREREKRIRYTLDCLRLAAAMGIPSVSTGAGGRIPDSMDYREAWRLFLANMHRVTPLAKRLGVKLLIQTDPELLLKSSGELISFLEELEFVESLRVDFNVAHVVCAGEDPCAAWERLHPFVSHVHLCDVPENRSHRHIQLGEGVVDIPGFLRCLMETGYEGYVTIELDSHERDAEEMVSHSAQYLREQGFLSSEPGPCARS